MIDNMILDNIILDNMILDSMILDNMMLDNMMLDKIIDGLEITCAACQTTATSQQCLPLGLILLSTNQRGKEGV